MFFIRSRLAWLKRGFEGREWLCGSIGLLWIVVPTAKPVLPINIFVRH
jgi:hypothetical protein